MARALLTRPIGYPSLSSSLTAVSGLIQTRPRRSTTRLVVIVLVVLSKILRILELTMPRVELARPRVRILTRHDPCLVAQTCARAFDLVIFLVWMWMGAWRVVSILLLCIFVHYCCYFAPFVSFSSFDPVN
ncbi:hypothetical protein Hanom_Chr11g01024721 [Helianthus anomalus]